MIVLCLVVYRQVKKGIVMVEGKNEYVNRYLNDLSFRTHVSLYLSLTINVVYAVVKFFSGFIYHSFWFGSIAVYYFRGKWLQGMQFKEIVKMQREE